MMLPNKLTVADIRAMKSSGEKISMLTAYDYGFARLISEIGIEMILVGDTLGMVVLGYDSTVPVTMEDMIHHAKAVGRAGVKSVLIGDMPFMSYQTGIKDALVNAGRFMKEAGCDGVKLEGGLPVCDTVAALVRAGIPVVGHIGLTPQTAGQLGGYRVQGKDIDSARGLLEAAAGLEKAGVFALVLECIPAELAGLITERLTIPTIGIGAGADCDGQVLVTQDLLGLFEKFTPSFVKKYVDLAPAIKAALKAFREEVRGKSFPDRKHSFAMKDDVVSKLREEIGQDK